MFKFVSFLLGCLASCAVALAHGPQLQITNDGNKITTHRLFLDGPYNVAPAPASPQTNVYVIPLAPATSFGGTAWFARPADPFANGPGIAWTQGWTYTDGSNFTMTFPAGANFVQTILGGLKKLDGSSFVTAPGGAQLQILRAAGNAGVSGSADAAIEYKPLVAPDGPTSTILEDHQGATFQLLGNGVVPSSGNPPASVGDGVYLAEMKLSLANQPVGSAIADSDSFYFVFYKGVPQSSAISATTAAFPGASIQAVPEPASLATLSTIVFGYAAVRRRERGRRM